MPHEPAHARPTSASPDPRPLLTEALQGFAGDYAELRYHRKRTRTVAVERGRVDQARASEHTGVGVRVMVDGALGFATTSDLEAGAIRTALDEATRAARASARAARGPRRTPPPRTALAVGRFEAPGVDDVALRPLGEALDLTLRLEERARAASARIASASCAYNEILEEKGIVTSDGASAWTRLVRPEFRVSAVASEGGEMQRGGRSIGATGSWDCMFRAGSAEALVDEAARMAVDLLSAGFPDAGRRKLLLSPALVGLLAHEAIGHTVEADFVRAGSCAAATPGPRLASDLVNLCDSGASPYDDGASGMLHVDDEGVLTQDVTIIREGRLASYLHDRESAAHFEVAPTGNSRAWEYDDEPLIRMRNTFVMPGESSLEEMIAGIDDGLMLDGASNGQADANGEFMFGTRQAWPIKNGKLGPLQRGVNISGLAFDVLSTVDAVSSDFRWELGAGYCGKGQPAKVDAGGPWLACTMLVGSRA
ncbi:MAG: TldD/PmbA family protein [Planctomycetota bacterium]